ncbi:hypothetical protein [Candidatus Lokiarchaeum ossiferum]|uniref:hypothetical protein n=1 Tax=Candidatus Lokiarchaeum ossiferum TaxID=2951803 RepID=UPI00352EDA08
MVSYAIGILFGILAGCSNFFGQILQKKAINDLPAEQASNNLMKQLIHSRTWILGFIIMSVGSAVFMFLAQLVVGAALIPGLMASGFIVLAIGSSMILKEKLTTKEFLAIFMLVLAVVLISGSQLAIEADISYFESSQFNLRIGTSSFVCLVLWLSLFYYGKRIQKFKSIPLAIGTGFPFVINNLWMGPFAATFSPIFESSATIIIWVVFGIGLVVTIVVNVLGISHYQYALEAGNASLVVPLQQLPQQIAPILIYYFIYQLNSPTNYSFILLVVGIILILIAGAILANRQIALESESLQS